MITACVMNVLLQFAVVMTKKECKQKVQKNICIFATRAPRFAAVAGQKGSPQQRRVGCGGHPISVQHKLAPPLRNTRARPDITTPHAAKICISFNSLGIKSAHDNLIIWSAYPRNYSPQHIARMFISTDRHKIAAGYRTHYISSSPALFLVIPHLPLTNDNE